MGRSEVTPNARIGVYYALGAALLVLAAGAWWPRGAPLYWPAFSFALVAAGYFGVGPAIYGKKGGRLPWRTRLLLAPMLLGQWLSLRYYQRQCRPWDEAMPGLLMGKKLSAGESEALLECGVTAVLDLTAEFSEGEVLRRGVYLNLPILDLTAPTPAHLERAVAFIRQEIKEGVVYVHCKIGYSRTAAVVGAYLLAAGESGTVDEAVARMRAARPSLVVRPEARAALRAYAAC